MALVLVSRAFHDRHICHAVLLLVLRLEDQSNRVDHERIFHREQCILFGVARVGLRRNRISDISLLHSTHFFELEP
jgi:hypothetical protein